MAAKRKVEEEEPWEPCNTFQDHSDRFPLDQLLRRQGFAIWSRDPVKGPEWRRNGKIYTQAAALETIDQWLVRDALYAEDIYRDVALPD